MLHDAETENIHCCVVVIKVFLILLSVLNNHT